MTVLRSVKEFKLNEGNLMANGLFNTSFLDDEGVTQVSLWFDAETKDELLEMEDSEFVDEVIELVGEID